MRRQLTLPESLRARAYLVRAELEDLDIEALAIHLEEAAARIEYLERRLTIRAERDVWLH